MVVEIEFLEGCDFFAEDFCGCTIGGLFRFHRIDDDVVEQFEFVSVVVGAGFDALGEKVVGAFVDDLLRVAFFVVGPANQLLVVLSAECVLGREFCDLSAGFGDGCDVLFEFTEFEFVTVNAAGHLAVGAGCLDGRER